MWRTLTLQKEKVVSDRRKAFGKEHSCFVTKLRKKHMGPLDFEQTQVLTTNKARFTHLDDELKEMQKDRDNTTFKKIVTLLV